MNKYESLIAKMCNIPMVCLALGGIVRSDDIPRNGGDGDRSDVIPLRASKSAAFIVKSAIRRGGGKGSLKGSVMLSKGFRSAWHIYKSTTLADLPLGYGCSHQS